MRHWRTLAVLAVCAAGGLLVALLAGSVPLPAAEVLNVLFAQSPGIAHDIVWELRLPRALAAFVCGSLLAVSGVLLQVL
jgi:iron complex transport system permease protein